MARPETEMTSHSLYIHILQVDGLRNMLLRKKLTPTAAASTQPRTRDPDVFDRIGNNRNSSASNSSSTYSRTTLNADRNTQEQQKSVKSRLSLPNKSGSGSIRITTTNRSMRYLNIRCGRVVTDFLPYPKFRKSLPS